MGKHYGKTIINDVLKLKCEGKIHREIAEKFGLTTIQIKRLVERYNRTQREINIKIPRRRGRPPKSSALTEKQKDKEIRQLRMENELLRDFLHLAGRK